MLCRVYKLPVLLKSHKAISVPFRVINNFQYKVGFPITFLSVIIYLIISFVIKMYQKFKNKDVK